MFEIWIATPEIPNMKTFESPTGESIAVNWLHVCRSTKNPGSIAVLKYVDDKGETLLGQKSW